MNNKKTYTSVQKAEIIREYLEDNVPISELSEKYEILPNTLYNWRKQILEEAPMTLSRKSKREEKQKMAELKRIAELEALLAKRETLIAELVAENIGLKKNINGAALERNGWSRKSGTR